jgi:hypothetical protein
LSKEVKNFQVILSIAFFAVNGFLAMISELSEASKYCILARGQRNLSTSDLKKNFTLASNPRISVASDVIGTSDLGSAWSLMPSIAKFL